MLGGGSESSDSSGEVAHPTTSNADTVSGGSESNYSSGDVVRPTTSTVDNTTSRLQNLEYELRLERAQRQADRNRAEEELAAAQAETVRIQEQLENDLQTARDSMLEENRRPAPGNERWRDDVAFHNFTKSLGKHTLRIAQGGAAKIIARNSIDAKDGGNPTLFTLWRVCQLSGIPISDLIRRAERE